MPPSSELCEVCTTRVPGLRWVLAFLPQNKQYPFFGTLLDTRRNLESNAPNLAAVVKAAGEVAGQMALRLVHDHLLRLNTEKYLNIMRIQVSKINKDVMNLQRVRVTELLSES